MPRNFDSRLDAVMQAEGDRSLLDNVYDDWAQEYDKDLWASGNPYFAVLAGLTARHVPELSARILDCGCGTGLVGRMLWLMGYRNLEGLDPSGGMLDAARAKGCYVRLHQLLLGATIDLDAESFDALTAGGVLTQGHAPPESLDGMLALARPGALILFSMSNAGYSKYGFGEKIKTLEARGAWTPVEQSEAFPSYPFSKEHSDLQHWVSVYQKAG